MITVGFSLQSFSLQERLIFPEHSQNISIFTLWIISSRTINL